MNIPEGLTPEEIEEFTHVYETRLGVLVGAGCSSLINHMLAQEEAEDWIKRKRDHDRANDY
jgi:hypothetical protein